MLQRFMSSSSFGSRAEGVSSYTSISKKYPSVVVTHQGLELCCYVMILDGSVGYTLQVFICAVLALSALQRGGEI